MYHSDNCLHCQKCVHTCPEKAITAAVDGRIHINFNKCTGCLSCVQGCPGRALTNEGEYKTVDEVVEVCMQDSFFYEESGGGVTLSGGEVMAMDSDYIQKLVKKLYREGVSIAIDTCGQAPYSNFEAILPYVDTWLYDIKAIDDEKHKQYMGVSNSLILDNLRRIAKSGARIYIRIPTVKEVNGDPESMAQIIDFLKETGIQTPQVNLLPYHSTGSHKYCKLGREYPAAELTAPSDEEMESFVEQWNKAGFANVKIGG
jgi:pyruvate formate lyase activating enzyme